MKYKKMFSVFIIIVLFSLFILSSTSMAYYYDDGVNEGEKYYGYGDSIVRCSGYADIDTPFYDCFVSVMCETYDSSENADHNIDGGGQSTTWGVTNFASHFDSGNDYFIFMFDASDEATTSKLTGQNMLWLYNHTLENGTTPILCVGVLGGDDAPTTYDDQENDNNAIMSACENFSIPYVKLFDAIDVTPWDGSMPPNNGNGDWINSSLYCQGNSSANVHPNTLGHERMAEFLWFFINGSDYTETYYAGNDTTVINVNYNETIYTDRKAGWNWTDIVVHCVDNDTDISWTQGYNNKIHFNGIDGNTYEVSNGDETLTDINIISINNQGNDTIVVTGMRYFNWTKITGATIYHLQVSNSSSFTTPFINFSNISEGCDFESMPGGSYTELGNYVEFYLPYAYNISWDGSHYYRVRAYRTS